ncbi:TlpA disulfide reductase family protein [Singulisphaera sp. Ch08]|uniref:TlpA disulfide reductase family protein n=1 Tax=Singulisphaera sp. Ch08 TaxID=3120278 RepID=A0AAU7CIT2_9BACT
MRQFQNLLQTLIVVLMASPVLQGADSRPKETLAGLKEAYDVAIEEKRAKKPGVSQSEALARFRKTAAALARRALILAKANPDTPTAVDTLAWIHTDLSGASSETAEVLDASYDLIVERYLDRDEIVPVCWLAANQALEPPHSETFLRAAADRSPNLRVRGVACYALGRTQHELARVARALNAPITQKIIERNLGPKLCARVRTRQAEEYRRDAETAYERTIKEYSDQLSPVPASPPLGKQAEDALFRLRYLEVGCNLPEVVGEDLDGIPLKLSNFRGKVMLISFWAAWCEPCMRLVPAEKELVERMKGRPFVLIGVNGDGDRAKARAVSANEGLNWRSFWDHGPKGPIATKWNVSRWPTIYVIDAEGKIRDDGILYFEHFHQKSLANCFEQWVAEAEARLR